MIIQANWIIGKIKDETGVAAIEEFVGLKPNIYSYLLENNEHKKAKGVNKNVVSTISHYEYKDVLLNNNCIGHSMNRIQSKYHNTFVPKYILKYIMKIFNTI